MSPSELVERAGARSFVPVAPLAAHQDQFARIASYVHYYTGIDLSSQLRDGVDLLFRGPPGARYAPNHSSARMHADAVERQVAKYVEAGTVLGPFDSRPFPRSNMAINPLGAVVKDVTSIRVITDLTASGVNAHIRSPSFSYAKLDAFLHGITASSWIFKVDVDSAFLRIAVRPEDWHLLVFILNGKYYFFIRLVFGGASSPRLFCIVADSIREAFAARWQPVFDFVISSFSDDSFGKSDDYDSLCAVFELWCQTLRACGLPTSTKPGKCVPPCRALDLLGVRVDVLANSVALTSEKRARWLPLVLGWLSKAVLRKELEKMIGILGWLAYIQPLVRSFVGPFRDLFHSSTMRAEWSAAGCLNRPLELVLPVESDFVKDLLTSASCSRRLYQVSPGSTVCVFSDAALSTGLAGAVSSDGHVERFDCRASLVDGIFDEINSLECEGALRAALVWATSRTQEGDRLVLFTDNSATVGWLRKGRVPTRPYLNSMLQQLALVLARRSLTLVVNHVPGRKNRAADAISRGKPLTAEFWLELADFEAAALLAGCDA
jgi:hypothetical protein